MKQTVANDDAVVFECELPEPRDKVWRALTERELLAAWLMPNDICPEVGAKFQLRPSTDAASRGPAEGAAPVERAAACGLAEGVALRERSAALGESAAVPRKRDAAPRPPVECEVLAAEPGRTLRWRQREPADAVSSRYFIESVVSFELADTADGGTLLRVVHNGFTTVARCSTVVALRPRAKAAITPKAAVAPNAAITPKITMAAMSCSLRRAA